MQVTPQIAEAIDTLWNEDVIRLVYDLRAKLPIVESSAYFWDKIKEIAKSDYLPTDEDILLVRRRTTGNVIRFYDKDL